MSVMMKAGAFVEPDRIELADKRIPDVGPNHALMHHAYRYLCFSMLWRDNSELRVERLSGSFPIPGYETRQFSISFSRQTRTIKRSRSASPARVASLS